MRGEYSPSSHIQQAHLGSPPLARGIHNSRHIDPAIFGITPACAGNTLAQKTLLHNRKDHPRLRGEYKRELTDSGLRVGSPPLARGIPFYGNRHYAEFRITPACAGNTFPHPHSNSRSGDHPRLRGEYSISAGFRFVSPRITPACAGNTKETEINV